MCLGATYLFQHQLRFLSNDMRNNYIVVGIVSELVISKPLLPCLKLGIQPMIGNRCILLVYYLELRIMVVALLYLVLAGAYLLAMPAAILLYLKLRWYVVSSFERGFMYFLVFFFFPGLLLLSPFVNFRPHRRQIPV